MKSKYKVRSIVPAFRHMLGNRFSQSVKLIRSDNLLEFMLNAFYSSKGIVHQRTCVETPQHNRIAERKHQHFLNVARALLFQATLPIRFWGDGYFSCNTSDQPDCQLCFEIRTPYEVFFFFGKKPAYHYLRVFGCFYFASTLQHNRKKFEPRAIKCIFLGYSLGTKGYKLYDLIHKKVFVLRDVIFYEHIFPFKGGISSI